MKDYLRGTFHDLQLRGDINIACSLNGGRIPYDAKLGARARGRAHARALRDVAWANGYDVAGYEESPDETGTECHAFGTKAHAEAARAVWSLALPHAPLPPRWGLVVRAVEVDGGLWVVSITDDTGMPVANL
jgi:hypothetical protein